MCVHDVPKPTTPKINLNAESAIHHPLATHSWELKCSERADVVANAIALTMDFLTHVSKLKINHANALTEQDRR